MPNTKLKCLYCEYEGYRLEKHNELNHKELILSQVNEKTTIPAFIDNRYVCLVCYQAYKDNQEGWLANHFNRTPNCCTNNQFKMLKSIIEAKKAPAPPKRDEEMDKYICIKPAITLNAEKSPLPVKPVAPSTQTKFFNYVKAIQEFQSKISQTSTHVFQYETARENVKSAYEIILLESKQTALADLEELYKRGKELLLNESNTNEPNTKKQAKLSKTN